MRGCINNGRLEMKCTETSRSKALFFGVHKKSESITEYRITKAPSWSQLQIFFTWYALHIVFLSFVQLFSFFCVSVRCVYLLFFIIEPTLNKHLPAVSRGYTMCVCIWVCFWLWFIRQYSFFLLHLNSMHTRVCGIYVEICLHIVSLSIFR